MTSVERDERLTNIELDMARLVRIIEGEGDPDLNPGVVGLLRRQTDYQRTNNERVDKIERTIDRFRWTVAGFATAGGVLGGGLVYLISLVVPEAPLP